MNPDMWQYETLRKVVELIADEVVTGNSIVPVCREALIFTEGLQNAATSET